MGDFNAACSYVRDTEWKNIRLANDKRFWWLIDDCQDTTLKGSRCAYDRPYFTYWISFVQTTVLIITLAVYGFAPVGFTVSEQVAR
ncbi:Hypothetical predicted protein, partial [Paramuricea clavata]